jgi:hypothetical protein
LQADQPLQSVYAFSEDSPSFVNVFGSQPDFLQGVPVVSAPIAELTPELRDAANQFAIQLSGWLHDNSQQSLAQQCCVVFDLSKAQTRGSGLEFDHVLNQLAADFKSSPEQLSTLEKTLRSRLEELFPNISEQSLKTKVESAVEQTVRFLGWEIVNDLKREQHAAAARNQMNTQVTSQDVQAVSSSLLCQECNFAFGNAAVKQIHDQKVHMHGTSRYVSNVCLQLGLAGGIPPESLKLLERVIASIEAALPITLFIQIQTDPHPNQTHVWRWFYQGRAFCEGHRSTLADLNTCFEALLHWIGLPENWLNDVSLMDQIRRLDQNYPHLWVMREGWTIRELRQILCHFLSESPTDFNWMWFHNHLQDIVAPRPPQAELDSQSAVELATSNLNANRRSNLFYTTIRRDFQWQFTAKGALTAGCKRLLLDELRATVAYKEAVLLLDSHLVEPCRKAVQSEFPKIRVEARPKNEALLSAGTTSVNQTTGLQKRPIV